jgi:arginase
VTARGDAPAARAGAAWTVLDAPSNLGLRPPAPGVEPGVKGLADALRGCAIVERLGARDAGRVTPPAYVLDDLQACRALIPGYTRELAERIGALLDAGERPLVLGGDCSILLGALLALRRRGRYGLLHVDGHLDFRHPGWSGGIGAVAGEDLAAVTGRLEPELSDIDGLSPYVADEDTVHLGERERDPGERAAIAATGITVADLPALRVVGAVKPDVPYWLHVDADVLDLAAVDSPAPGGLSFAELAALLQEVAPSAVGVQVTVFDPTLDTDGSQARDLTDCLVSGLAP